MLCRPLFTLFVHDPHRATLSLREQRLIFSTPRENPEDSPDRAPERTGDDLVNMNRDQLGEMIRNIIREETRNQPNVRESIRRRENVNEQGGEEEDTGNNRTQNERVDQSQAIPPTQQENLPAHSLAISKKPDSAALNTAITSGIIGGSVYAGMNAANFAGIPVLGKVASAIGAGLDAASTGISGALTKVGAPSQLSFLAHPWFIGLTTPILGLWMLGKYRIHTLKNFYLSNPNHPNAKETLARIQQIENTKSILARNWYPIREGIKLIAGTVRLPFRGIPETLGAITGRIAGFVSGIGKKLGGLKGIVTWPRKNFRHLAIGGIGGGTAAGIGTYALGNALAAGTGASVLGPWAIPIATVAGALYGYRLSKRRKGAPATIATAET